MPENFASFYRKACSVRELVGKAPFPEKARFQITKVIELPKEQYAGAGGRDQDERPHHPGADGPWLIQRHRPSVLTVSSPFSRALRTR